MGPISRRRFLARAAAAWATVNILPGRILGGNGQVPPSRQVTLGFIGVGNRGGTDAQWGTLAGFIENPQCRILAVCDVNRLHTEKAKAFVDAKYGNQDCSTYRDFRELLAREDIEAVVISTPTHWHAVMTILACEHGKDVYCEKPLAYTIRQGRAMVEAARRYRRVVQVGTQSRSSSKQQLLYRLIQDGQTDTPANRGGLWRTQPFHHSTVACPSGAGVPGLGSLGGAWRVAAVS